MKQRFVITCLLLLSCIVMTAASVFPHHHHGDRICMHLNTANRHVETCDNGCVSHFNVRVPEKAQSKAKVQAQRSTPLQLAATILRITLQTIYSTHEKTPVPHDVPVLKQHCMPVRTLRAPPAA